MSSLLPAPAFPLLFKILHRSLKQTGALLLNHFDRPGKISFKNGSPINLVTKVDKAADALIQKIIRAEFPGHDFLTEESEPTMLNSPYRWIVDPLDGTTNYAHHFPHACVSIGLEYRQKGEGRIILGGVYDPFRDELFWAAKGKGAWLEHANRRKRIRVSKTPTLQQSLLITGFPYDRNQNIDLYLSYIREFMLGIQGIRRAGASALDLCWVACGRVEGYWEWRLKPWDCAAGQIIVEEAGGRLSDFSGRPYNLYGEQTLASNGLVHAGILNVMERLKR